MHLEEARSFASVVQGGERIKKISSHVVWPLTLVLVCSLPFLFLELHI